jgi:hypothetical protein
MKFRSSFAKGVLAAAIVAVTFASGGCDDDPVQHVINPNTIPPGPSPVVEEMRPVSGVSGVVLDGVGHVYVRQSGTESLRVRTEEHILPFIRTEMQGGQLVIGFVEGTSYHGQASVIEFDLTVVDLDRVELSGAGQISLTNVSTDQLSLVHSGTGTIDLNGLAATRLEATRSGTGTIVASGSVQQQSVVLDGVGNYDARNLDSATAEITIRAIGSATVQVSERLEARIDGSGSVYYIGDPIVQRTGNGSGSVRPVGE